MNKILFFNEDCFKTINNMVEFNQKVDIVLTSPPYNTGRPSNSKRSRDNREGRYDIYIDNLSQEDYCDWCVKVFNAFNKVLNKDGVILWNVSYGSDATVNTESIGLVWLSIADIIKNTDFTVADRIIWKKSSALPNNVSKNKLTRIVEDVFVFCRKEEYKTFNANKEISSIGKNGQTFYKNYYNFIEAKNNDGVCKLNKATYSSDLCKQLLNIYAKTGDTIYDPFMGSGTTAIACEDLGLNCFGSELSTAQVEFSKKRLEKFRLNKEK